MVQYDDTVVGAELEQLRSIGSPSIVVAPAASPLPARIVATAWTWKLSCSAVDLRTLEAFAAERPADARSRLTLRAVSLTPGNDLFESLEGLLQIGLVPLRIADHLDEAGRATSTSRTTR